MAKMTKTKRQMQETAITNTADVLQPGEALAAVASGRTAGGGTDPAPEPDHDQIARLAHSYWEVRGGEGGSPEDDWFRAERELRASK